MPTLADFRAKLPSLEGLNDDQALSYLQQRYAPDVPVEAIAQRLGIKIAAPEVKAPKRSLMAVANDTVIEAANAAAGTVGAVTNFVSPGNRVSKFIDENIIAPGEASQSDAVRADKEKFRASLENAEGMGDEVAAVGRYVMDSPLQAAAQAAGSFVVPGMAIKGAGALAGAAGAGAKGVARAGLGGGAALGAAGAGGDAAGTAYELAMRAGATEEEATAAARQASVIPGAIGAAGGMIGAERAFAGAGGFKGGLMARALKTAGVEGAQEGIEEGVTQYEGQRAAMPFDPTIDPMKGAAGAATLGAVLGAATGGGVSLLQRQQAEADKGLDDLKAATDPDAMVDAALRATNVPLDVPPADITADGEILPPGTKPRVRNASAIEEIRQLDPAQQQEALGLLATAQSPQSSPAVRRYAQNRLDVLLEPFRKAAAPLDFTKESPGFDPGLSDSTSYDGIDYTPDFQTGALDLVPERIPTAEATEIDPLPTGDANELTMSEAAGLVPSAAAPKRIPAGRATELTPDTIELGNEIPQPDVIEAGGDLPLPEGMAPRTPKQPEATPAKPMTDADIVAAVVDGFRKTNTPQARAFVQEFDAGRITPADVLALVGRPPQSPDERLAAAAAQAPKKTDIQPGDILTVDGQPFGTRSGAYVRAKKEGGDVIEVPGGWAVRPKESAREQPDVAGATPGPLGARDGGSPPAAPGGGNLRPDADGTAGVDRGGPTTAPRSGGGAAVAVAPGGGPDAPLTVLQLKRAWSDAAARGDSAEAARINEQIVAAKKNAAAPAVTKATASPAEAPGVAAPALEPRKPTLMDKMTEAAGGPVTFGDLKKADAATKTGEAANETSDYPERWAASGWASGEYEARTRWLGRAGVKEGSDAFAATIDSPWSALPAGVKARVLAAIRDEERNGVAPKNAETAAAAPDQPKTLKERRDAANEREPFEHAGLKVYPGRVRVGDQIEDRWAVQLPENKGTNKVLGDTLHAMREEAMKAAEREVARFEREQRNRAEQDAAEATRKAEEDARKAANRGKSLVERRADATLDRETSENGERMTRRQWVDRKVAEGLTPRVTQEDKIKPLTRTQFNRATGEEQRAHERKVKAAGTKEVYWIGDYEVTKTEYDYAKSRPAPETSTSAQPALASESVVAQQAAPDDAIDPFTLDKATLNRRLDQIVAADEAPDLMRAFVVLRKRYMAATGKPSIPPAGSRAVPMYPEGAAPATAQQVPPAEATLKRTEARRTAKHPQTVMGSRLLAQVSISLDGLHPSLLSEFSERFETARKDRYGRPMMQWRNPMIPGVGLLFRRSGTSDRSQIAQTLEDYGYLPPGTFERDYKEAGEQAKDLIRAALNREEVKTQDEIEADAIADQEAERQAYYAEVDAESAAELEAERAAIMAGDNLTTQELDALTDEDLFDGQGTTDTEASMRAMGFTEQEIADELAKEAAARAAKAGAQKDRQDEARGARPAAEDRGAAARPAGQEGLKRPPVAEGDRIRFTSNDGTVLDGMAVQVLDTSGGNYRIKIHTDEPAPQGGGNISRTVYSQDGTFAPLADEPLLTAQTAEDLKAKANREEAATKAAASKKAAEQERLRKEAEARDNKARADATVDDFQLGQDANRQMSGMGDMFADQQPEAAPTTDPFAADYAALVGKTIEQTVTTDDGKTAKLRMDAARALRDFDQRQKTLQDLKACLGRNG